MHETRSTNPSLVPVKSEPAPHLKFPLLDTNSVSLLAHLEHQLSSGKTPLSTKAIALATIKAQGLARIHNLTFQDYCDRRLRLKRSRVHQLIEFAELLKATAGSGTLPPADNERQLRPLKRLPRADWATAWVEAVHTAPAGKVTGQHVQSVVDARLAKMQTVGVPTPAPASDQPPAEATTPIPSPHPTDAAMSMPSTPASTAGAHEFIPTVPAPHVTMPGWKDSWVKIARDPARPPASLRSGVFGWQPGDS